MARRRPSGAEIELVRLLVRDSRGKAIVPLDWEDQLLVESLDDGGMGSMRLILGSEQKTRFGSVASEFEFTDSDGVKVLASLYLNQDSVPFEIDVWKTDFSALKEIRLQQKT
jgi:hypothetical protein